MMKVQEGKVKLPEGEVTCTYATTEDGGQFIFIAGGELPNGCRLVAKDILEGLNKTNGIFKTLGLIDKEGNVLIPLENKNINIVDNKYILAEKANPNSDEVILLQEMKNDPLKLSEFLNTKSTIKTNIGMVAGDNSQDIYANPEGVASLYTLDGKNLVDGKYFNYIMKGSKGFAFGTNRVEDKIETYEENTIPTPLEPVGVEVTEPEEKSTEVKEESGEEKTSEVSVVSEVTPVVENNSSQDIEKEEVQEKKIEPVEEKEEVQENEKQEEKKEPKLETEADKVAFNAGRVIEDLLQKVEEVEKKNSELTDEVNELKETLHQRDDTIEDLNKINEENEKIISDQNKKIASYQESVDNLAEISKKAFEVLGLDEESEEKVYKLAA